jgi:hypothetical protein
MNAYLERISQELDIVHIEHTVYHDCVHINLPNEFGILEIKVWGENDDSIQIFDGDFHTHGELEAIEFGLCKEKAIAKLANKLITGEYLLIEETEPNKKPRKLVAQSIDDYLKYLPKGTEYKIANGT